MNTNTLAKLLADNPNMAATSHGVYYVILPGFTAEQQRAIFCLSDFKVESCEGGCYWLRPCSVQTAQQ